MRRIAHIIHPVVVPATSDLVVAQPITFESMRMAAEFARRRVDVDLAAVTYADEQPDVPEWFRRLPGLDRCVCDVAKFEQRRKLALLKDILDRLVADSDAEYVIYTNVDIAVQPYFYLLVNEMIDQGYDAFAINRRTISDRCSRPAELPQMWAEVGTPHRGHDCFIFRTDAYSRYELGKVCVGSGWVGRVLLWNLLCFANRFAEFKGLHATLHVGNPRAWKSKGKSEYLDHNRDQAQRVHAVLRPVAEICAARGVDNKILRQLLRPLQRRNRFERTARTLAGHLHRIRTDLRGKGTRQV